MRVCFKSAFRMRIRIQKGLKELKRREKQIQMTDLLYCRAVFQIRIYYMRIQIQAFRRMRIRIQIQWKKILCL
jgi:hypothetical protein